MSEYTLMLEIEMEGLKSELAEARAQIAAKDAALVDWAVERWNAEVSNRPLVNIHRRTLDDTWRQVIRHAGGDPDALIGPSHDELLAAPARET